MDDLRIITDSVTDYRALPIAELERRSNRREPAAQFQMMRVSLYGLDQGQCDAQKAFDCARALSNSNSGQLLGKAMTAILTHDGIGTEKNIERAQVMRDGVRAALAKAAKGDPLAEPVIAGNLYAQYYLATFRRQNIDYARTTLKQDETETRANSQLGIIARWKFTRGINNRRSTLVSDESAAISGYEAAAKLLPEAAFDYGMCFVNGTGRQIRPDLAGKLLTVAADNGHAGAQIIAARIYYQGWGVKADHTQARAYLMSAHVQAHPEAARALREISSGSAQNRDTRLDLV